MIVFTQEEAIENNAIYHKSCFICNKEYWSTSRNTRYCSQECAEKGQKKIVAKNKIKKRRRKEYDANKEINRALSKAYALAHDIMELYHVPKVCRCKEFGFEDECSGAIELHHQNGNPFDNSASNLYYLCRHHHGMADDLHPEVNMVDTYNESIDAAGFEEDDQKYKVMIEYTTNKINGIKEEDLNGVSDFI